MKEIPILFTPELAQLVHEGRKTVTRRPAIFSKDNRVHEDYAKRLGALLDAGLNVSFDAGYSLWSSARSKKILDVPLVSAPYAKGDLLWVRNSFYDLPAPSTNPGNYRIWDEVTKIVRWKTGEEIHGGNPHLDDWRHRPSIHMPKWACRTWLKVLKVSVERVQEITDDEAAKEGFGLRDRGQEVYSMYAGKWVEEFKQVWKSIYPGSWERNDWVWRVEFERVGKGAR